MDIEEDDIYVVADEETKVDTESVVSAKDLIKKLNSTNSNMPNQKGGLPPKPAKPAITISTKDLKKTQGTLRSVEDGLGAKKFPKEDNKSINSTNSENSIANELAQKLAARRKCNEVEVTVNHQNTQPAVPVDSGGSIASDLAKGLLDFEKKKQQLQNDAAKKDEKPPETVSRPVNLATTKPAEPKKRPPEPLPKKGSYTVTKPVKSPNKEKPATSPKVKEDANNNLTNEINKRKAEYEFEIITHKGCKYLAYKLPLNANKPKKPFRTSDIVLPAKYSENSVTTERAISIIEPTASDDEDDVKPPTPQAPRPSLPTVATLQAPRPSLPTVTIKGSTLGATAEDDIYDDGESGKPPAGDEEDGEVYEIFDEDEAKQIKEKLEEEKRQEEKRKKLEDKKKNKEKKKQEKLKEKFKLDGSERVLFKGKAKEKIGILFGATFFEKGDDVPVVRTDDKVNPKGKWLVQLKDGKYEYVDTRQIEREEKQQLITDTGYDEENIYEGEDDYDEGFSGSVPSAVQEEDIYEEM